MRPGNLSVRQNRAGQSDWPIKDTDSQSFFDKLIIIFLYFSCANNLTICYNIPIIAVFCQIRRSNF